VLALDLRPEPPGQQAGPDPQIADSTRMTLAGPGG
jgi:hypothetical protein